ncbi:mannose-binding protein C-like [Entelurus aequoreus]|uniref:mannose-binding protein C-like n=1 Tax=Entelurus aequoreus TaxID=161455 RepID=UPI002B1E8044|nr:mannose-binding protein C-like [Entelurus aequoreus]
MCSEQRKEDSSCVDSEDATGLPASPGAKGGPGVQGEPGPRGHAGMTSGRERTDGVPGAQGLSGTKRVKIMSSYTSPQNLSTLTDSLTEIKSWLHSQLPQTQLTNLPCSSSAPNPSPKLLTTPLCPHPLTSATSESF